MLMLIPNRSRSNRILWLTSCHACLNTMLESSFSPGNQILHLGTSNPSSSRRFTCYLTTTTGNLCYRVQRNISIGIAFFIINLLPRGMYVAKETRKVYIMYKYPLWRHRCGISICKIICGIINSSTTLLFLF